jgi:hypothetical protein
LPMIGMMKSIFVHHHRFYWVLLLLQREHRGWTRRLACSVPWFLLVAVAVGSGQWQVESCNTFAHALSAAPTKQNKTSCQSPIAEMTLQSAICKP